jgi:transposase-like protein
MDDAERFRLLGKYRTPQFRIGRIVFCEVRGEMVITGMTDAPILWPVGRRGRERPSLVVYKDLAKAIRRESNQAVAHWWGVHPQTVTKWRRLLGVERATEGTSRLQSEYDKEPWADAMRAKSRAKARDPERCRKISEAHRGKLKPQHVMDTMREAGRGKRHTEGLDARSVRPICGTAGSFPVRLCGHRRMTNCCGRCRWRRSCGGQGGASLRCTRGGAG